MTIQPASIDDIQQAVRGHRHLAIRGGGTKSGARATPDPVLDLRSWTGVLEYSPQECVFSARGGTPLAEIDALLRSQGQFLPFDPPFAADGATLAGTAAAGVNGPGRYRYGGVRDFLIGALVVDGEGRAIRSGGMVVKNAAGFLLHHGLVGSLGRFGVVAELALKVFPLPEAQRTVTVTCDSLAGAAAMARAVAARGAECDAIDFDDRGVLQIRMSGRAEVLDARVSALADRVGIAASALQAPAPTRSQEPGHGAGEASCVKVAGVLDHWARVHAHVAEARFLCAGSVAWLTTRDLAALSSALADAGLAGHVIRGAGAGRLVGHLPHNEFEARVQRVLDPQGRFRAAHDSVD